MPASPVDSAIYRDLFADAEAAQIFTDSAEVRAMLLVEGALAKVQGKIGLIPEVSGRAIHRASRDVVLDPAELAPATGTNGVPVPALVAAFRRSLEAPEHAQYVHWGATTQDIMDTALVLRLRRVLALCAERIDTALARLAGLAEAYASLPMAARTWGQAALPTTFGAVAAQWGRPLLVHRTQLTELRPRLLAVSLAGAAGTLSAMAPHGAAVRAALAHELDLADPGHGWHAERGRIAEVSGWMTALAASLGKMGEDLTLLAQSGIGEVDLGGGGASSTMPQKSNPVAPSLLVALARQTAALDSAVQAAGIHRQQRDAAAWMTEWMSLPQIALATARALSVAGDLAGRVAPIPERMAATVGGGLGLIHAEALTFALAADMPRPDAQATVKDLCREAQATGTPLPELAAARWPGRGLERVLTPEAQLGTAPEEARAFAVAVRAGG